jgi:hypothetical protein
MLIIKESIAARIYRSEPYKISFKKLWPYGVLSLILLIYLINTSFLKDHIKTADIRFITTLAVSLPFIFTINAIVMFAGYRYKGCKWIIDSKGIKCSGIIYGHMKWGRVSRYIVSELEINKEYYQIIIEPIKSWWSNNKPLIVVGGPEPNSKSVIEYINSHMSKNGA